MDRDYDRPMNSIGKAETYLAGQGSGKLPIIVESSEVFETPDLNDVAALWHAKRGQKRFPSRDDFSMRDLKSVLRSLAFLDVVEAPAGLRFLVRYMGSELDAQLVPMTGRFTDEVLDAYFQRKWHHVWNYCLRNACLSRSISRAEYRERQYAYVEGFYAPLASDGEHIDKIMIVACYHQAEAPTEVSRRCAETLKHRFVSEFGNV
jgi:PAS domain